MPSMAGSRRAEAQYLEGSIDELFVSLTMPHTVMRSALEPKEPRPSGLRRARAADVDERLDAQTHEHGCQHHHSSL